MQRGGAAIPSGTCDAARRDNLVAADQRQNGCQSGVWVFAEGGRVGQTTSADPSGLAPTGRKRQRSLPEGTLGQSSTRRRYASGSPTTLTVGDERGTGLWQAVYEALG